MVQSIAVAILVGMLLPQGSSPPAWKKYDIKSGVVTYEQTLEAGTMKIASKIIVTFDDYGMKECQDTYSDGVLKESLFSDGKKMYSTHYAKKTTYRRGDAFRGVAYRFAWEDISEKDKSSGIAKQSGKMTVAGKSCESYVVNLSGSKTTYAGWAHICLWMESISTSTKSILKAIKLEENLTIPAEKFAPPAGFAVKDSPY
jgi:hypothetical protein